jgi:uncharacterized protein YbjT (DUF2867 family)
MCAPSKPRQLIDNHSFLNIMMKVAIFPAAGALGGATLSHLLDTCDFPPSSLILISRSPSKLEARSAQGVDTRVADFDAPESFQGVFAGVSALNLISYPSFEHKHRFDVSYLAGHAHE